MLGGFLSSISGACLLASYVLSLGRRSPAMCKTVSQPRRECPMNDLDRIRYRNDPIVEVVCEFRFIPDTEWDLTVPGLLYDKLQADFPKKGMLRTVESRVGTDEDALRQQVSFGERVRFLQEDEKAFIQVAPNWLAVNHLKPYPQWENFRPLIRRGFETYVEVAQPRGLQRIGLRYINLVQFEVERIELEDYFTFRPEYPCLSEMMFDVFIVGIEVAYEDERDKLRMQLTSARPESPYRLAVALDLDYFLNRAEAIPLHEAMDWIDQAAHTHIQQAFEDCLTSKLKSMFRPE
jgi:uncharacterized protein (TIGR04255 family)